MAIKVLLVDDQLPILEDLGRLLAGEAGIRVVGTAASGEEAVRLAGLLRPDVVVMDAKMPGIGGVEATRRTRGAVPAVRVIGLSLDTGDGVREAMGGVGAVGFVAKEEAFEELPVAIRLVAGA